MAALIPGLQARQSSTSLLNQLFSGRLCKGANYFSRSEILSGADSNMILSALCERSRRGHFDSNHSHLILLPVSHCPLGQPHLFPPPWVWDRHSLADSRVYVKKKNLLLAALWIGSVVPWVLGAAPSWGGRFGMGWVGIINDPGSSQCQTGVTGALNSPSCHIPSFAPQILPALQQAALKRTRRGEVSLVLSFHVPVWKFAAIKASPPPEPQRAHRVMGGVSLPPPGPAAALGWSLIIRDPAPCRISVLGFSAPGCLWLEETEIPISARSSDDVH